MSGSILLQDLRSCCDNDSLLACSSTESSCHESLACLYESIRESFLAIQGHLTLGVPACCVEADSACVHAADPALADHQSTWGKTTAFLISIELAATAGAPKQKALILVFRGTEPFENLEVTCMASHVTFQFTTPEVTAAHANRMALKASSLQMAAASS